MKRKTIEENRKLIEECKERIYNNCIIMLKENPKCLDVFIEVE